MPWRILRGRRLFDFLALSDTTTCLTELFLFWIKRRTNHACRFYATCRGNAFAWREVELILFGLIYREWFLLNRS